MQDKPLVRKTITGLGIAVFSAWEPATNHAVVEVHGAPLQAFDHGVAIIGQSLQRLGQAGTRRLPPDLAELQAGAERYEKCRLWQLGETQRALAAILEAYPNEVKGGRPVGAEVHVFFDEPRVPVRVHLLGKDVTVELPGQEKLGQAVQEAFTQRFAGAAQAEAEGKVFVPTRIVLQPRGEDVSQLGQMPLGVVSEIEGPGWWLALEVEVREGTGEEPQLEAELGEEDREVLLTDAGEQRVVELLEAQRQEKP